MAKFISVQFNLTHIITPSTGVQIFFKCFLWCFACLNLYLWQRQIYHYKANCTTHITLHRAWNYSS